jgi:hypothetical protein
MNFQQLRFVREAVRRGLKLTEAADALRASQGDRKLRALAGGGELYEL